MGYMTDTPVLSIDTFPECYQACKATQLVFIVQPVGWHPVLPISQCHRKFNLWWAGLNGLHPTHLLLPGGLL